jgi:hypothetical protein
MLKQTYNPSDVSPDEINKQLEREIDKGSTEDLIKDGHNGQFNLLGDAFHIGNDNSAENLRKWLKERDVSIDFTGTKWVAKSVDVFRVNVSKLNRPLRQVSQNLKLAILK